MGEHEQGDAAAETAANTAIQAGESGATTGGGATRTQHVIHVRPHDEEAAVQAIAPAIARVNPDEPVTQVVIVTPDAETAADLAARAGAVLPVTSARRAARMLRDRAHAAIAGAPRDLLALVRESVLKLEQVRAVVIAWGDEIAATGQLESLDALLAEIPKDAVRSLVVRAMNESLEALAERHLWKARRLGGDADAPVAGVVIDYVTVAPSGRG